MATFNNLLVFHFTHLANIPNILRYGILADNLINKANYINSGNLQIKEVRKIKKITEDIKVGDCVPFYFAPRSPMLYTQVINNKVDQRQLVYIICNISKLINTKIWFCSDMNAAIGYANFTSNKDEILNYIDINLMSSTSWKNTVDDENRMQRRMAEFLVFERVFFNDIDHFAVYDDSIRNQLIQIINNLKPILIRRDFYF